MGLTGRPKNEIGLLATSKLYTFHDQILAFIPQVGESCNTNKFYESILLLIQLFAFDIFQLWHHFGTIWYFWKSHIYLSLSICLIYVHVASGSHQQERNGVCDFSDGRWTSVLSPQRHSLKAGHVRQWRGLPIVVLEQPRSATAHIPSLIQP